MQIILNLLLIIATLSLVNYIYIDRGYPSLLDLWKEIYVEYIINVVKPFRYKKYKAIIYYSYMSKTYNARILIHGKKGERIDLFPSKSLRSLRKQFKQGVNDYINYLQNE